MGPLSCHTAQEGDMFCLLEMNVLWCEKCKSIQNSKGPCEDTGGKILLYLDPQKNEFYIDIT
jgi:predicted nucleic-acid-binding Zn-ribbon protein